MFSGFHIEYPPISPVNLWDPLQPCDDGYPWLSGYPNEPFLGAVLSLRTMQWDEKTLCLWSDMIFKWWKKTSREMAKLDASTVCLKIGQYLNGIPPIKQS